MIINIIVTILSILGIYGFYSNNLILLFVGAGAVIFEIIVGLLSNELKSVFPTLLSCIIGIVVTKNPLIGISIGLCFESVIMSILGWIMIILYAKK